MRATLLYGAGDVRVETVPDAEIVEPTDAVITVTHACICGSDLWPYKSMEASEVGRPIGHEAIGVVEAVGADVRTMKVGDLVVMPFAYSDGTCVFCHEGLHTSCIHGGCTHRHDLSKTAKASSPNISSRLLRAESSVPCKPARVL